MTVNLRHPARHPRRPVSLRQAFDATTAALNHFLHVWAHTLDGQVPDCPWCGTSQ